MEGEKQVRSQEIQTAKFASSPVGPKNIPKMEEIEKCAISASRSSKKNSLHPKINPAHRQRGATISHAPGQLHNKSDGKKNQL
jgi:hypothetical protein